MLKFQILPNPRQGSCILGLLTAPSITGEDAVSIINDYKGLSLLVDSIIYFEFIDSGTTLDTYDVIDSTIAATEHDVAVSYESGNMMVNVPIMDNKPFITNRVIVNTSVVKETLVFYRFRSGRYLWKSEYTGSSYSTLKSVGAEIYNDIYFTKLSGATIVPLFDIGLPSTTLNGFELPEGIYSFTVYMNSVPTDAVTVNYNAYDISTGATAFCSVPLDLEKIYDNSRYRSMTSIAASGSAEYTIPFSTSTGLFGGYTGGSRVSIRDGIE